jgi:hypothetical protein
VTIPYSSAIVAGIVEGIIEWTEDPDFGYDVAAVVPGRRRHRDPPAPPPLRPAGPGR